MRVLVHDYSGHPFQVQLSRALAARSHEVLHVYCSSYETGRGAVVPQDDDPETLRIEAIDLGERFDRYSMPHRVRQELAYGKLFARRAAAARPDVVLSSNDPLLAKACSAAWCRATRTPWVFWLQDVYSNAMANYASQRFGLAGSVPGRVFVGIERRLAREAASVVAITEDFLPLLAGWGVPESRRHVLHNWAPLQELHPAPKDNPWSRAHGLHDRRVLLYSGTLGLKHDPGLLVALAERFRHEEDVRVVVASEGLGAGWLAREMEERRLENLVLLPYQPYEQLSQVFGSADVLLALLQGDAGVFSVPSKILSYLCVGRPILAAMPGANLATRTLERADAGLVVEPGDHLAFVAAAEKLVSDEVLRNDLGSRARRYAERTFDIETISSRFEAILRAAAASN